MANTRVRLKHTNGKTRVRLIIQHATETGRREVSEGRTIPAYFVETVTVEYNRRVIAHCTLGVGVSNDPYFTFYFRGGQPGGRVAVAWVDNLGQTGSAEAIL